GRAVRESAHRLPPGGLLDRHNPGLRQDLSSRGHPLSKEQEMDRLNSPMSRRGFLGTVGALGGAAALAACGGKSKPGAGGDAGSAAGGTSYNGPNVTLKFWNGWTGADGDFAKKMVAEFNQKYPKIHVN